jgi:uncharacterized membrane protein
MNLGISPNDTAVITTAGTIRHSIDIEAPVASVFRHCAQFQDYPDIFPALREVVPLDPNGVRHRFTFANPAGFAWDTEITELSPDRRIGWRNLSGFIEAGQVTLLALSDHATEVQVELQCRDANSIRAGVQDGLARLKGYVESRNEVSSQRDF